MKTTIFIFLITITALISSCKKEKEQGWLPSIKGYYKCSFDSTTLPKGLITISEGGRTYEIHDLGAGRKFVKLISGFSPDLIGEELLNKKAYVYYANSVHQNTLEYNEWLNWFIRNHDEGFNFPVKKLGIFILPLSGGQGKLLYTGEAFVAWTWMTGPIVKDNNNLYNGFPEEWLTMEELRRNDIFCSLPILNN